MTFLGTMIIIDREDLKTDPDFREIFNVVKEKHEVAAHTVKLLKENSQIEGFSVQDSHFAIMGDHDPLFLSYDTSSWYLPPDQARVRIEKIIVYVDFLEYERNRLKILYSGGECTGDRSN